MAVHTRNTCDRIKEAYALILLIFSCVIVGGLIFTKQTALSSTVPSAVAFIVMWAAIAWLTMIEGGQAAMVGLVPVNRELYKDTHPRSYDATAVICKGDNLDRYLLGRQLMVVLIVFIVNICGSPLKGAELWGLPAWITNIFLVTGIAMVLFTCMVGQLNSQVNGCHCMLDYSNNYFCLFTLYVAMVIEFSGLLHVSYVFQMIIAKLAGKEIESKEEERSTLQSIFFWIRCLLSTVCLGLAFAVTIGAIVQGKTTMWDGVPKAVSVILFFVLMSFVGLLEGMQIAFFAVIKVTKEERGKSPWAMKTCELLFRGEGKNLPAFMVGRQICVVTIMFVVARITTLNIAVGEGNMYGVSDGVQKFLNTGLLGALITTIVGSIVWQLVASAFPIAFLSNPMVYIFLRICLALESTGVCAGAWVLAEIHAKIAAFQRDEVYIGTPEERAAKDFGDDDNLVLGMGHPRKLPTFIENAPAALKELAKSDPAVLAYIDSIRKMEQGRETEAEESD